MTTDQMGTLRASEAWVESHVPRSDRIMVDDTMWVDLVEHGFSPRLEMVWFYKLGLASNIDPSVARAFPQGWREFQYVVSTPTIRIALLPDPNHRSQVGQAVAHSRVVATFGTGQSRIEIRRIELRRNVVADRSS
jgi:hypothetical protein